MGLGRTIAVIMGVALLLTLCGCENGKRAATIAAQRKAGDAVGARQKAVEALTEDADQMGVWCKLAFCDEVLGRDVRLSREERVGFLVEGSLLSAAVCGQHPGATLDDRWEAVTTMLLGDLETGMTAVLGKVTVHFRQEVRHSSKARMMLPSQKDFSNDRDDDHGYVEQPSVEMWREADPAEAEAAARLYACMKPLSLRLSQRVTQPEATTTAGALSELETWAQDRNLQAATLSAEYEAGEQRVAAAYARALEDLQDLGYFQASTILHHGILEP